MAKYKLKEGVLIYPFGNQCEPITNETLTDDLAEYLLSTNKASKNDFEPTDVEPTVIQEISLEDLAKPETQKPTTKPNPKNK